MGQPQRESLWLITGDALESNSGRFFWVVRGVSLPLLSFLSRDVRARWCCETKKG